MAGNEFRLTDAEKARITKFLEEKWKDKTCPICNVESWAQSAVITTGIPVSPESASVNLFGLHTSVLPSVSMVCTNCGYTINFNAIILGIEFKKKEEGQNG